MGPQVNNVVRADSAEMSRLASRVQGRAQDVFTGVDFEAGAGAVSGSEFAQVLHDVNDALKRAGGGASERLQNISTLVKTTATALTGQDAVNSRRVGGIGEVSV